MIPAADDPLAALCEEFADADESVEELRQGGRQEALDEAGR